MSNIKEIRHWDIETVRNACIKHNLYTCGNSEEYDNMLGCAEMLYPDAETLYLVAKDIVAHSDEQTVSNVMFILANDAVTTYFEFEEE